MNFGLRAHGRVALAITRQGSHRSVRAHIRAYGSSTSRFAARKGSRSYSIQLRGQGLEPRSVPHVSLDRVGWLTLRFPPQGPPGRVPLLRRYHPSAATSCRPSRHASLPSLGGTSAVTRSVRSAADECAVAAGSWSPGSSGRDVDEETTGSPKFLGDPDCPFAHVPHRRRQDRGHQTVTVPRRGPGLSNGQGSRKGSFDAP